MKERCIAMMETALSAYTDAHIRRYLADVQTEGLKEHGFPRLCANIGILIAHGRRTDLLPLFLEMMDTCCEQMASVKAANDFSVREVVCCLMELEPKHILPEETFARWKALLRSIEPERCYDVYAKTPEDRVYNWAAFSMLSEWVRQYWGLCDATEFVDIQIPTQLHWLDENGMYRDPNNPMVYDLIPRFLFAQLLHFGYRGRYFQAIDDCLRKAGLLTLYMQSAAGELAFGGRSNQFLHNEPMMAAVLEYEARRYFAEGNLALAAKFRLRAKMAMDCLEEWLAKTPIHHIKNRFPLETRYGCEDYGYFDKYMITTASQLYYAYLLSDDSIPVAEADDGTPYVWQTSEHFHKVFLRSGAYSLEIDTDADPHYDACGLGRVHRAGAPSAICLSVPATAEPAYHIDRTDAVFMAIAPGVWKNGVWQFAVHTPYEVPYRLEIPDAAAAVTTCTVDGVSIETQYTVHPDRVEIAVTGDGAIGCMLPAFAFDGEVHPAITLEPQEASIVYQGWICRYTTTGTLQDTGKIACNRNGHYRVLCASGEDTLQVQITIEPLA